MVEEQKFRSDLFYRLNVFPIRVPALRERPEDIPLLARHFAQQFARCINKSIGSIPVETMNALCQYSWPGNIRELQNLVERAVILSRDGVFPNPLHTRPTELMTPTLHRPRTCQLSVSSDSDRTLIQETLEQVGWIVGGPRGAAAKLGLKRTTLLAKMRRLGISRPIPQDKTDVIRIA